MSPSFAVLFGLWALVQGGLASKNQAYPPPTAAEIALIRQSWEIANANAEKDMPTRIIAAHLEAHPNVAKLLPDLEGVPLADIPTNDIVINRVRPLVHLGLTFIIDNLDSHDILAAALPRIGANSKLYVDYVSPQQQNAESARIIVNVLEQELGSRLSPETSGAWQKALNYAFSLLLLKPTATTSSDLAASDVALVRKSWASLKNNVDIPANALIKMFELHPATRLLYPELADVPLKELNANKHFTLHASMAGSIVNLLVLNLDNDRFIKQLLHKHTKANRLVSYMDPVYQIDEVGRIFLEAVEEQVVLNRETKLAWNNVLDHLSFVSASAIDSNLAHIPAAVLSANRALVRDNWALIRASNQNEESLSSESVCTKLDKFCPDLVYPAPDAAEIALVRQSWGMAKQEKDIPTRIIVEFLQAHPKLVDLLPGLEGIGLADVPTNDIVVNRFRPLVHLALTFIIDNLDSHDILAAALPRIGASNKLHVDYVSPQQQNAEAVRIVVNVMEQELGSQLNYKTKSAWKKSLNYAFSLLLAKQAATTSLQLSASDIALVRQSWSSSTNNADVPANALIKMFEMHPATQLLYPELADVPLKELNANKDFMLHASMAGSVVDLLILNLEDDQFIKQLLHKHIKANRLVSYIDPVYQIDEVGRVFLEALQEKVTLDEPTKLAWNYVLDYLSLVSASALDSKVARCPSSVLSANRALVRDNWALIRNSVKASR